MTYEEIISILDKYNIGTINELEYCLSVFDTYDECQDDPVDSDKNCTNAKCYEEYFVPDCRKIFEIYEKYFQKDIKTKKLFIKYLEDSTSKSKSSIENYMSCKSCNQQIKNGIQNSLKISDSEFKKDFCNNLSIKFSYKNLFETEYQSIGQFLNMEHQVTIDNFIPLYNEEDAMTKEEEKKLFDIVHVSKEEFKNNLSKKENLIGSDKYIFNLASYAFDRGLVDECMILLDNLTKTSQEYPQKVKFLQLKAKVLSYQNKDREAIEILKELIEITKPSIDAESNNLLAASIKRDAFSEYEKYSDEKLLVKRLSEAKDIYHSVYKLNTDYYPALNYIYLNFMLGYINNEDKKYFIDLQNKTKSIWESTNHKITDWWSFVANVEYLILMGQYDDAKQQLEIHFDELDKDEITEFNISSTLRQLNLYRNFCNEKELSDIIEYIGNINK